MGSGWYEVVGKHGALVRATAALDSAYVCELKESQKIFVTEMTKVDALNAPNPKTTPQVL